MNHHHREKSTLTQRAFFLFSPHKIREIGQDIPRKIRENEPQTPRKIRDSLLQNIQTPRKIRDTSLTKYGIFAVQFRVGKCFPLTKYGKKRRRFPLSLAKYGFRNLGGKKPDRYGVFKDHPSQNTGTFFETSLRKYGS